MPIYLHKSTSKLQAETLLRNSLLDGSYLVRDSETYPGAYVLCLWSDGKLFQYRIKLNDDGLLVLAVREGLRERKFATLDTLIQHYVGLGAQNGLACGLSCAVPVPDLTENSTESAESDNEQYQDPVLTQITQPVDNITPFLRHRTTILDLSVVDGEFVEALRDYIDEHVRHDAMCASAPAATPAIATPHLCKLLQEHSRSLERELHLFTLKLEVCSQLFEPRHNEANDYNLSCGSSTEPSLDSLLDKMAACKARVDSLLNKASDTLQDLSTNQRELAYQVARIANVNSTSDSLKYIPPCEFEVKTNKGNLQQLKQVNLAIDLQAGNLRETSHDSGVVDIQHDKIEQIIKSQANSCALDMKLEGQKKKKALVFSDVRAREKFCQLVQTMKNLHQEGDRLDTLSIYVGSFNMGDDSPRDSLSAWLRCQGQGKTLDDSLCLLSHDLYVIGTQESAVSEKHWCNLMKKTLFNLFNIHFQTVVVESLWGIRLIVLCKPSLWNDISHVESSTVKTGIANALGNKGAVGVAFNVYSTSLCFICCHLTSGDEKNARRNQNYRDILRGLSLGDKKLTSFDLTKRFHHLFWFGDLNYRVDANIETVLESIDKNALTSLLQRDQLTTSKAAKEGFHIFSEEPITFTPTYRYEKGSKKTYAWKKIKKTTIRINVPSWCDRVLWLSYPGTYIENLAYGCQDDVVSSDHHPLFASFRLGVIQQYAAKMTSSKNRDDVIIEFQQCEAEIRTSCRQNFCLEFHSTCLDGHVTSSSSISYYVDSLMLTSGVRWKKLALPKLQPIVADRDFLEDQYLLIAVRSTDSCELYGECVLGLKAHISTAPQYFECYLTRYGEETGILRGEMHVTSLSARVDLSKRRRTVRTYECVGVSGEGYCAAVDDDDEHNHNNESRLSVDYSEIRQPNRSRSPVVSPTNRTRNPVADIKHEAATPPPIPPRHDPL